MQEIKVRKTDYTLHKKSYTREYGIYCDIIDGCYNKNSKSYKLYGEKGIEVCNEWVDDVSLFFKWLELNKYDEKSVVSRINKEKNFSPSNCIVATKKYTNRASVKIQKNNVSGFRGVSYDKSRNKWTSQICVDYKRIHIGRYDNAVDAAIAYDDYIINNNLEHTLNEVSDEKII